MMKKTRRKQKQQKKKRKSNESFVHLYLSFLNRMWWRIVSRFSLVKQSFSCLTWSSCTWCKNFFDFQRLMFIRIGRLLFNFEISFFNRCFSIDLLIQMRWMRMMMMMIRGWKTKIDEGNYYEFSPEISKLINEMKKWNSLCTHQIIVLVFLSQAYIPSSNDNTSILSRRIVKRSKSKGVHLFRTKS